MHIIQGFIFLYIIHGTVFEGSTSRAINEVARTVKYSYVSRRQMEKEQLGSGCVWDAFIAKNTVLVLY